jgi:hypothetical protein
MKLIAIALLLTLTACVREQPAPGQVWASPDGDPFDANIPHNCHVLAVSNGYVQYWWKSDLCGNLTGSLPVEVFTCMGRVK